MLAGSLSVSICHLHVHFHSLEGFRADEPERYVVYSQLNQISQSVTCFSVKVKQSQVFGGIAAQRVLSTIIFSYL